MTPEKVDQLSGHSLRLGRQPGDGVTRDPTERGSPDVELGDNREASDPQDTPRSAKRTS